jgi:iron complex outermembrane receptor protein
MNIHYAFNRSRSLDIKESRQKQLIYVPEHQLNGSVRTVLRNFSAGLTGSYTGKRYTTADNSSSLPGYTLVNFNAGYSFRTGRNIFDIAFRADNLLNKQYEVIAWYPMPGRSFLLSLTWQFSGK